MSKPKQTGLKPGQVAVIPGLYEQRGPKGGHGPQVTVPGGHKLPPAPKGSTFDLKQPADNKSGRGK